MNMDRLIKIGTALVGGGVLLVNIIHAGIIASDWPEAFAVQMLVVVPGLVTGIVLVAGARTGKTADRGFVGMCMALVGAVFLWTGIVSGASWDSGTEVLDFYKILVFGPVGVPLGVALLVIGLRIFAREKLVGFCMAILGAGFLPFLVYVVVNYTLGAEAADILPVTELITHGSAIVGAVLLVPSLVILWQTRRTLGHDA